MELAGRPRMMRLTSPGLPHGQQHWGYTAMQMLSTLRQAGSCSFNRTPVHGEHWQRESGCRVAVRLEQPLRGCRCMMLIAEGVCYSAGSMLRWLVCQRRGCKMNWASAFDCNFVQVVAKHGSGVGLPSKEHPRIRQIQIHDLFSSKRHAEEA